MSGPGQPSNPHPDSGAACFPGADAPQSAAQAIGMALAGLGWLARADAASLPAIVQADALRGLERALSVHAAARAKVLAAFDAQGSYENDAARSARSWLAWQTRTTPAAASGAVGWMRRLANHPRVADALADAVVSASWARQICDWSDALPYGARADADVILLAAAIGGADLADLASLAEQIRRRTARADEDDDGFDDRRLRLEATFRGAGKVDGDLTPRCAQALAAVLEALGKKTGPEDIRTRDQRWHDALEEACRRMIAAGGLPDRAGQPTQIQLHISLDELLARLSGDHDTGPGRRDAPRPARPSHAWPRPTWPGPAAAPGDECDASIYPIVTGRVDHELLDRLASRFVATPAAATTALGCTCHGCTGPGCTSPGCTSPGCAGDGAKRHDSASHTRPSHASARDLILTNAIALLSGPDGLTSLLRNGHLTGPAASVSLPLDVGTTTDTIPAHLRRAVILRDRHCASPGCDQPPAGCQIHHVIPRSDGGPTALTSLVLLCTFHHLVMIHRWGWTLTLNPDGTTTIRSPDGSRTYHSHGPPATAA